MELFGTGIGCKKFALAISGVGLLLTLACGTSSAPVEPSAGSAAAIEPSAGNAAAIEPSDGHEGSMSDSTLTESADPVVPSESVDAEPIPVSYTIGNNVGERIPDFAITLVDGSTVTSEELLAQRQPTFLFFFETW